MLVPHCLGRATIESNGYQDVLVAISPEVGKKDSQRNILGQLSTKMLHSLSNSTYSLQEAEDPALVERIKDLLTDASAELYNATR